MMLRIPTVAVGEIISHIRYTFPESTISMKEEVETHMKKICTVLLCLLMVVGLHACGRSSAGPDSVVRVFSEAMKKTDFEEMSKAVKGNEYDPSVLDLSDEITKQLFDYMKSENTKITYTIDKTAVDGDKGNVDVTYKYSDASPIVEATMGDYFTKAIGMAFGGASEEEMGKMFLSLFTENAKKVSAAQAESKVTYSCVKTDGGWEIEKLPDEVTDILTCNINLNLCITNKHFVLIWQDCYIT